MSFAIIETGAKQYRVAEGESVAIEKLPGTYQDGDTIVFDRVLLMDDGTTTTLGTPYIEGATIEAVFSGSGKAKHILVRKFKSKSRYSRRYGHRQPFMKVKIGATK